MHWLITRIEQIEQHKLIDQIEQSIDQSWAVDQEQTEQTDSQNGHSNQASNIFYI